MQNYKWMVLLMMITIVACQKKSEPSDNSMADHTKVSKPKVDIKTVGILLYDGYTALDAMGPYQVLSELTGTKVFFVGRNKGMITSSSGMKVQVDTSIADVKQLDMLVIPGGFKDTYLATKDMDLVEWVKKIDSTTKYTAAVCTGAWILAATGVLEKKVATTHWYGKKILADEFGAKVTDNRYVNDGKYWTSAGVTAGLDMSLALLNEIMGEQYTKMAMLDLEYDPNPPFKGGSESNTDKDIVATLRTMYNTGMESALHPEKAFKGVVLANKVDYICEMPVHPKSIRDTAMYKGKVYGFCSTQCKIEFNKSPNEYLNN